MNEFDDMIKVGELADKKVANEIVTTLLKENIHLTQVYDEKTGLYVLYTRDENSASTAFDYYRVRVGLAAPPRPMPKEWDEIKSIPLGSITLLFIGISLCVFVSKMFIGDALFQFFFISKQKEVFLKEFYEGQVWRVFTPVFLHFNFLHILFNCLWMKDLGSLIESYKGKIFYVSLLLGTSVLSNLGQYVVKGPFFGGLSGIVYGLLGFVWVNKKIDTKATYSLPKSDVLMMIGWFFLCFTGVFGPVANTAHGVGLGVGMIFGVFSGSLSNGTWNTIKVTSYLILAVLFGGGTLLFELYVLPMITNG